MLIVYGILTVMQTFNLCWEIDQIIYTMDAVSKKQFFLNLLLYFYIKKLIV